MPTRGSDAGRFILTLAYMCLFGVLGEAMGILVGLAVGRVGTANLIIGGIIGAAAGVLWAMRSASQPAVAGSCRSTPYGKARHSPSVRSGAIDDADTPGGAAAAAPPINTFIKLLN